MADHSNIAWTDATFNPWIGCTRVSPACDRCYAAEWAKRYTPNVKWGEPGQKSVLHRTALANWKKPLAWQRKTAKEGRTIKVFCSSLADVFDNDADPTWRADLWGIIRATPNLTWQLLTKRPQNISKMLPIDWGNGWPNVWLGTTTENQEEYDRRRLHLLKIPARVHFFSCEPMLSRIIPDHTNESGKKIWYIVGGESGHGFRTLDMDAVADLRQDCANRGVAFFFKQDSSLRPGSRGRASDSLWSAKSFPYGEKEEG